MSVPFQDIGTHLELIIPEEKKASLLHLCPSTRETTSPFLPPLQTKRIVRRGVGTDVGTCGGILNHLVVGSQHTYATTKIALEE